MRLRRSDLNRPGYTRRRRGKGFSYADEHGAPLTDPGQLRRLKDLVIPPAWTDVWICNDPRGHIQAVGTDQAGRRQYRYHDVWRAKRDAAKFEHMLGVAERLPTLRARVAEDLGRRGYPKRRVLAAAVRLLDEGVFRIGGEAYASEESGSGEATFGLATLRREHVSVRGAAMEFRYPAKGGIERVQRIVDPAVAPVVRGLLRRDDDAAELLAYRDRVRGWRDVRSADINGYLREATGCQISAKDFRTWHATVLAAVTLADPALPATSPSARKRARSRAMREVSTYLGNTPAVARASYVDPRVTDLYDEGVTVDTTLAGTPTVGAVAERYAQERDVAEQAVLRLLRDS
ncbi:MAG TPA: DNA topoisomerase IB [Micromonosporaceae bacterium]|nr:DNA topoisomerase IB [Micromonosporaceae bacterium]